MSHPSRRSSSRQPTGQREWVLDDRLRVRLLGAAGMGSERIARRRRRRFLRGRRLAYATPAVAEPLRRRLVLDQVEDFDRARTRRQDAYGLAAAGSRAHPPEPALIGITP